MSVLRMAAVVMTATVLFAGCGGDSSSDAGGSPTSAPTGATEDVTSNDRGGESGPGSDVVPGTGFVQIGDLRHELAVELCANIYGGINGRAVSVSDPGTFKVVFNIAPEDWAGGDLFDDPGSIQYSESGATSWTTGEKRYINDYQLPEGIDASTIKIDSHHISDDGESVTGEATFYDLNALVYGTPVPPEIGSFSFACPSS